MKRAGADTIGFLVGEVSRAFRRRFEAALGSAGVEITVEESRTLFHAAREDGMRQVALAERMGIEPMTLVSFLDRLEKRGLIARETDPSDRRAKIVRVTPAARPLLTRIDAVAEALRREAVTGLSASEIEVVRSALERMRGNLAMTSEEAAA